METGKTPLTPGENEFMESAFRHGSDFNRAADKAVYWEQVAVEARLLGFEQAHDSAAELASKMRKIAAERAVYDKRIADMEDTINRKVITGGCALPAIMIVVAIATLVVGR